MENSLKNVCLICWKHLCRGILATHNTWYATSELYRTVFGFSTNNFWIENKFVWPTYAVLEMLKIIFWCENFTSQKSHSPIKSLYCLITWFKMPILRLRGKPKQAPTRQTLHVLSKSLLAFHSLPPPCPEELARIRQRPQALCAQ